MHDRTRAQSAAASSHARVVSTALQHVCDLLAGPGARRYASAVYGCRRFAQGRAAAARVLLLTAAGCLGLLAIGCQTDSSWSGSLGVPDYAQFATDVYPILLRDCAYSQCHGAPERFFQIFGPGRTTLADAVPAATLLQREVQASYDRTRSMLISDGSRPIYESPLLLKPLDLGVGGASHGGVDVFGRNVYRTLNDPSYIALVSWAASGGPAALAIPSPPPSAASAGGTAGASGADAAESAGSVAGPSAGTDGPSGGAGVAAPIPVRGQR
jgi:hypothetical protein